MTADFLIAFDCDGVLVDSERLMQDIDLGLIADLGWTITLGEILDQHLGRSESAITANIERRLGRPVPDDFVQRRRAAHAEAFRSSLTEVPGVTAAVTDLQAAGYATCIASSGTHERIGRMLHTTDLDRLFSGRIFSGEDVTHGKPAPDLFLHAAAAMGYPPSCCVVVEDSPSGVAAARAAAMPVVGYCAVTPRAALADASLLLSDMRGLPVAIRELTA